MEKSNMKQERNGRESLRMLKPTVGCNDSKRRREESWRSDFFQTAVHCRAQNTHYTVGRGDGVT